MNNKLIFLKNKLQEDREKFILKLQSMDNILRLKLKTDLELIQRIKDNSEGKNG